MSFFNPPQIDPVCAVCIPPGARLNLHDLPVRLQRALDVRADETVTFTQLSAAAHTYRDAFRFSNGAVIRLQELNEGLRVTVLDLSLAEELNLEALREERAAFSPGPSPGVECENPGRGELDSQFDTAPPNPLILIEIG